MRVRNLTEADHDVWKRMRGELWPDCPAARQELELRMIVQKGDAYGVLLLESDDGRVGGFAEVSVRHGVDGAAYEDVGYLEGWYVEKDLRRRGGGRALVAAAELWARTRGLHEFGSDTGVDNEASIAAHRALGFRESDRIVQFLKPLDPG